MKQYIDVWEYAPQIMKAMEQGILMTTQADGETDTMTIGWGMLGREWYKPIFIAYVRQSRHTKSLVDKNPEFTINVPLEAIDKNIIAVCGTKSGRDMDKIRELGLTTVPGETVSVPGIAQLPLTLECKVVYRNDQFLEDIPEESRLRFYKPGTANDGDYHTAYYGEITAAYILQD
ncbi:MAG: flavin reductase family protein [Oscillospiraceae bacterium]|nr:flavin reductase family protein [Oscillospiraceae bacterium]